jgi:hypothetical protein
MIRIDNILSSVNVLRKRKSKATWVKLFIDGNAKKKEKGKGEKNVYTW